MFKRINLVLICLLWINPAEAMPIPKPFNQKNEFFKDKTDNSLNHLSNGRIHDLFIVHGTPKCGTHFIRPFFTLLTNQAILNRVVRTDYLEEAYHKNQIMMVTQVYAPGQAEVLKDNHHKVIAFTRDPRDALVSMVFYLRSLEDQPWNNNRRDFIKVGPQFDDLTLDQQITSLICGNEHAPSYIKFYLERIGWSLNPAHLVVKYEDLVGSAGGGSDEIRDACIINLANFIHLELSQEQLEKVTAEMYTDLGVCEAEGRVYKRSSIKNWIIFLNEEHKLLLKETIGEVLIELSYEKDLEW